MSCLENHAKFPFRLLLAVFFMGLCSLSLWASQTTIKSNDVGMQDTRAVSDLKLNAFQGLTENELASDFWILGGRAELDPSGRIYYDSELYCETLGSRSDYYSASQDSLLWTGYSVGRSLGLLLDNPLCLRPLKISNHRNDITVENEVKQYTANGLLNVNGQLLANGQADFSLVKHGKAMLFPADTLDNVIMTKQTDEYIVQSKATSESDTTSRIVYRWFINGSTVPIAVQSEGILYTSGSLSEDFQNRTNNSTEESDHIHSVIENAVVERTGHTVTITLSEELHLHIYIMDIPGNIYRSCNGNSDKYTLDISGLQHNTYFISIVSEESEYVRRILLTL